VRALLVLVIACGGAQTVRVRAPTTGTITGIARDHDSGDTIEQAIIHVGGREVTSNASGVYTLEKLAPGSYVVEATFAGQPVTVEHVTVRAGEPSVVDLTFTLGRPDPIHDDYTLLTKIDRYTPKHVAKGLALVEGTVSDTGSHERIAGAVVTAVGPATAPTTLQTISDDQGRYKFENVQPGVYVVSTYYSVGGRAQIEVRRSDIDVPVSQAVVVPLWLETTH
jgi:hypothetical protein